MAQGRAKSKDKIVATYDYTDAEGKLLYQVVRYEPNDKPKYFRQRRPDGNGGWIWKVAEQRVPYRWRELIQCPDATVFISEGEKDTDRIIAELNLCATTVAAGVWAEDCVKALAGRDIVILEDNDDAGRAKVQFPLEGPQKARWSKLRLRLPSGWTARPHVPSSVRTATGFIATPSVDRIATWG